MATTLLTVEIAKTLDYARSRRACVLIQGRTGRGKTTAAKQWCARKRNVYYVDCPPNGALQSLQNILMEVTGAASIRDMELSLSAQKATIILDECARLIPQRADRNAIALEWLRRLHDTGDVALVFIATNFFIKRCTAGGIGEYLEQFLGRFRDKCIIPDYVSEMETSHILAAFADSTAEGEEPELDGELVEWCCAVANESGQGGARRLWWLLEDAFAIAKANKRPIDLQLLKAVLYDYEGKERFQTGKK
ncbi:MAG: AAA family ATPase [Lentisphaerae bacterium]|nr:AAA family ATPase [Lentisphaerota bacterium]